MSLTVVQRVPVQSFFIIADEVGEESQHVLHAKSIQTHISEALVYVACSVVTSKSTTSESY